MRATGRWCLTCSARNANATRTRAAMPKLTDAELDEYLDVYVNSLSPKTVRSYHSALAPYYTYAHKQGFHPLEADPTRIESYLLGLMTGGKRDSIGTRHPDQPYSLSLLPDIPLRAETRRRRTRPAESLCVGQDRNTHPRLRPDPRIATATRRQNRSPPGATGRNRTER